MSEAVSLFHGARVRASDGAVLDSTPLYLGRTPMAGESFAQQAPAVAFDGTHYLVTWQGSPCGSQWIDPGVQATDACYGTLSPQVWRTGAVNGWVPGTYTVSYSLTDSGGNSAVPLTRTVEVTRCPW